MTTHELVENAVTNSTSIAKKGMLDKLFAKWFDRLVYPQIWEDPRADAQAMNLQKGSRIFCIASGSCNIFNYLIHRPASIEAVDLNGAHIALFHLKKAALTHLPTYDDFFSFFGFADKKENIKLYETYLRPHLNEATIAYWEGRDKLKKGRRIEYFAKGFYRYGLLGEFIGFAHKMAKLLGYDMTKVMEARTRREQTHLFHKHIAPIFDKKLVKMLCNNPVTLYSLGIPPSQFDKMIAESQGKMNDLLKERMRKLICDFPLDENYFAWQAIERRYDTKHHKAIPDYLKERYYVDIKGMTDVCHISHISMTDKLSSMEPLSLDAYTLLDAQDWMDDDALNELWFHIHRTATLGARVIYRTAGVEDVIVPRIDPAIQEKFMREESLSDVATKEDRSAIYGAVHVYTKIA